MGQELKELTIPEVQKLITKGKDKGMLTSDEIADSLQEIELSTEQIDNIYSKLLDLGIDVIDNSAEVVELPASETAEAEDEPEEAVPAGKKLDLTVKTLTNDPVRMYLKEIGKVSISKP